MKRDKELKKGKKVKAFEYRKYIVLISRNVSFLLRATALTSVSAALADVRPRICQTREIVLSDDNVRRKDVTWTDFGSYAAGCHLRCRSTACRTFLSNEVRHKRQTAAVIAKLCLTSLHAAFGPKDA